MNPIPMRCTLVGGAVFALAILATPVVSDAQPDVPAVPVVVAQTSAPTMAARDNGPQADAFPSYQRGVRNAAAESPEALRRYIWRTRMIYNFAYRDFAPNE
ncbi:MAG: hypothetical protein M3R40_12105 [Pseudomonadota bacterium]|nr:hypothetical protein [Pseudomonadota bacterium]